MRESNDQRSATWMRHVIATLLTALAYALVGVLALKLSLAGGYASPIFPSAGIALAATITFGLPGAIGSALGSIIANLWLAWSTAAAGATLQLAVPAAIGLGAGLQAMLGAALGQRAAGHPPRLREPGEILKFGAFAGVVACLFNASWSTAVLILSGAVAAADGLFIWWTWWMGDTLGVLIGAPIALALIGLPREEWAPRRTSVALPMLVGTLILGAASIVFDGWERRGIQDSFDHSATGAANAVNERLEDSMRVLLATHSAYANQPEGRRPELRAVAGVWLADAHRVPGLRAVGYSERVVRSELAAFEARAQAEGLAGFRVFERADGAEPARGDSHVVAIRAIEPALGNVAALGVNTLSIPAARPALLAAAATGESMSTTGFRLTQANRSDEIGVVIYRALYKGAPGTEAERLAQWRGVVFVTLDMDQVVRAVMARVKVPLRWCLVEPGAAPGAAARRLAGDAGCEQKPASADHSHLRTIHYGQQRWELRLHAAARDLPGGRHSGAWLFSIVGLAATSLLGLLLLTVTGRARRIELAVEERTQALSTEVAERRSAEEALRDSEQRLRSILDHVPIGVVFLDIQGQVLDSNPSLCRMMGRSAEELARLSVAELTTAGAQADIQGAARQLIVGERRQIERQMQLLRSDGSLLDVRTSVSALRDARGRTQRLVAVVEDITEHLRLAESERARDQAEAANRAKSDFVSRMSHELRTPLNAMLGFAQLLGMDRRPALAPHQAGWTAQIQHAGWHLLDMINDTLDLSRIEAGMVTLNEQALDVAPLVEACVALVSAAAERRKVHITTHVHPQAQRLMADETRLKQVLSNLLSNAIKYNREEGRVRVESRLAGDGMIELLVRDTGLGLSVEQLAALFQPYNRLGREHTAIEGTGIGLVISRRLTELMGGTIEAWSVEGQGSVFTVRLPPSRFSDSGSLVQGGMDTPAPRYQRRLVHYIEDNETNVEVMRGILDQRPQISLEVSLSGLDGLAAVRRRRPDLILLDMHLPDIGGLELLRHLKNDDAVADIPVIVLSADATPGRIEEALTLGALQYLTKPVDVTGFVLVLDAALADLDTRWG